MLALHRVCKSFGGVAAVRDVDLVVEFGERRALIGPNGAGKTTLFNLVTGELRPDKGVVRLFGTDVTSRSVQRRAALGLGRTYQVSNLFLALTVEENLFLALNGGKLPHLLRPWTAHTVGRRRAAEVARRVGLEGRLETPVGELSHGEQRQLELGLALSTDPRLIMLDEPSAGLSPSERRRMIELIAGLSRDVTVLLIEHDMDIALGVTDRVTVMHQGAVIAEGNPEEIRSHGQVQQIYLGESAGYG